MFWVLGLAALLVGMMVAVLVNAYRPKKKKKTTKAESEVEVNYGANTPWQAGARPVLYEGPSPSELLDNWKHFEDQEKLRWWQWEHLVGEFFRRENFDGVEVGEEDFADRGADIKAVWQGKAVVVNVTHYKSDKWASATEIRYFGRHGVKTAAAGYFITSGKIGNKGFDAASQLQPPVYALDGEQFWKALQAQRAGKSSKLPHPSP